MLAPAAVSLWAVTSYFNPAKFRGKPLNYARFRSGLRRQGVPLLTIECSFDGTFQLEDNCLRVRGDIMWQKERLLNIAIRRLPGDCDKIAWLDCDILFERDDWAEQTSALLEQYVLVQPFAEVARLAPGATAPDERVRYVSGFGAVHTRRADAPGATPFERHGHTGYAWAGRRTPLARHGLYDACVAGGADHLMAHAARGDAAGACTKRLLGEDTPQFVHFAAWAEAFGREVKGSLGHCPGRIVHLWHGSVDKRSYVERQRVLAMLDFDPSKDLCPTVDGAWAWSTRNPELARCMKEYFPSRDEDGLE